MFLTVLDEMEIQSFGAIEERYEEYSILVNDKSNILEPSFTDKKVLTGDLRWFVSSAADGCFMNDFLILFRMLQNFTDGIVLPAG